MSILFMRMGLTFTLHSSRCMSDPNFMALVLTVPKKQLNMLNTKTYQRLQSQLTVKSRSRPNADGGVNLYSSRCMHDPSFMALALIVSEKMT